MKRTCIFILIYISISCTNPTTSSMEDFESSDISTFPFIINDEIYLFTENYSSSYLYNRHDSCPSDAYFYSITSYDTKISIYLGTSVPHSSTHLSIGTPDDVVSVDSDETDPCYFTDMEYNFFVKKDNIKYNFQQGLFQKTILSQKKETSTDLIIFENTVFKNITHETLVLNARYDLVTTLLQVPQQP